MRTSELAHILNATNEKIRKEKKQQQQHQHVNSKCAQTHTLAAAAAGQKQQHKLNKLCAMRWNERSKKK